MGNANVEEAKKQLKKINDMISELDKVGVVAPRLKRAAAKLSKAIETGIALSEAAFEASKALEEDTKMLLAQCNGDVYCEMKIDRMYQKRSVDAVLNWDNKNSVIRNFVKKVICNNMPFESAKILRTCATEAPPKP